MNNSLEKHCSTLMQQAKAVAELKFSAQFITGDKNIILLNRHNAPFETNSFMTIKVNFHDMSFYWGEYDMNFDEAVKNFYSRIESSDFNPNTDTPSLDSITVAQDGKVADSTQEHKKGATHRDDSIEKISKAAAANLLFDLESGDLNAEISGILSPDVIFDAVQLSSSLTITVNNTHYQLKPYWPYLYDDNVLEILQDTYVTIESQLINQQKTLTQSGAKCA